MKKEDRRVRLTKKMLREALLQLLEHNELSDISITQLCKAADINRNTFYFHYDSPSDLFVEIEEEISSEIINGLSSSTETADIALTICNVLYNRKQVSKIIQLRSTKRKFMQKIFNHTRESQLEIWKKLAPKSDKQSLEKAMTYVIAGALAIIGEWIQNNFRESPEEISNIISRLSLAVVNQL